MKYVYKNTKSTFSGWDIPEDCVEITDEQYEKLMNNELEWQNDILVPHIKTKEELEKEKAREERRLKQTLKAKRQPLLNAFDKYRLNLYYNTLTDKEGNLIQETEQEHIAIAQWYLDLLELKPSALDTVPECIGRYL